MALAGWLALTSCGGSGQSDPSSSASTVARAEPVAVVEELIAALADDRIDDTTGLVDEEQLALLTFLDGTAAGDVAAMIDGGISSEVRAAFWTTFASSVTEISGEPVGRLRVTGDRVIESGFVVVETALGTTGRTSQWVVRSTGDGWEVDLLATFGGVFAPNLWAWSERLSDGPARQAILRSISDQRPSLAVAATMGADRLPDEALEALALLAGR
jgi:hypothetical protein